jgi:hypothetical protein
MTVCEQYRALGLKFALEIWIPKVPANSRYCGRLSMREIINWKPVVEVRNVRVIFFLIMALL